MSGEAVCQWCGQGFDLGARPTCERTGRLCKPAPLTAGAAPAAQDSAETVAETAVEAGVEAEEAAEVDRGSSDRAAESSENPADTGDNPPDTGAQPSEPADNPGDTPPRRRGNALLGDDGLFLPGTEEARGHPLPGSRRHGRPDHRDYDWEEIRRRYVEGVKNDQGFDWPTLDAVADHFGVPANRVREKSATQAWRAQRTQWQAQVEATRRHARALALAKKGLDLDNAAQGVAQLGLQLCQAKLAEIGQAAQAARSAAGPGGSSGGIIDPGEMQKIAAAVDVFHKVGLRAIGDPEVHRVELTGPGGSPIEIATELRRDDPSRITGVLSVLQQAGLGDLFGSEPAAAATLEAQRGADGVYSTEPAR